MRIRAAVVTSLLLAPLLAACGNGGDTVADPLACKAKLADNYSKAMANGGKGPTAEPPAACAGLDEKTLRQITGEVISEYFESDQAKEDLQDALKDSDLPFQDVPTPDVSDPTEELDDIQQELDDLLKDIDDAATP